MKNWINKAFIYHIYPLGALGAPMQNDFSSAPSHRLGQIRSWLDHIQSLGVNALYLGPLFESSRHGYDTANYYEVDRRLGTREDLRELSQDLHQRGMRLILDGVFNHVGRDFWAFKDVRTYGEKSIYKDWFVNLHFDSHSPFGDPFTYEGWNGHMSLVKLNLEHWAVREHLFNAIRMWVEEIGIDGLRLDAADALSFSFMKALSEFCHHLKPDFWLMGEVIHGDYCQWANPEMLDSVTNYQLYKGLYSSHNDHNYFELAYTIKQQFGRGGNYEGLQLYNFADNHDVNRIASQLKDPKHLYPLYLLLFTVPGIPSVYYGSEYGILGKRTQWEDQPLRPYFDLPKLQAYSPHPNLPADIRRLASIWQESEALREGNYQEIFVGPEQFAFMRTWNNEKVIVVVNSNEDEKILELKLSELKDETWVDVLNGGEKFLIENRILKLPLFGNWGRILRLC